MNTTTDTTLDTVDAVVDAVTTHQAVARGVTIRERSNGKFALRVMHASLEKPFYASFKDYAEALEYGNHLAANLAQGVVPAELLAPTSGANKPTSAEDPMVSAIIRDYVNNCSTLTKSDRDILMGGGLVKDLAHVRVRSVTYTYCEAFVARLKARRLAPATIRIRVGLVGRVLDWYYRSTTPDGETPPRNAMRMLPTGYSTYNPNEADTLRAAGHEVPRSGSRDRRLTAEESARIEAALAGVKRADRERALEVDPAFTMLYRLIVDTGLRLREAYRLRVEWIDLARGIILVEGSKGRGGEIKPRTVPIKPALHAELAAYLAGRIGRAFPWWDGTENDLERTTYQLSHRFARLFDYAQVTKCTEHDLRHEATCRWVTLRDAASGAFLFSDTELCRIMGWSDTRMLLRYASLRGEDLADRLRGAFPPPAAPASAAPAAPSAPVLAFAARRSA